MDSSTSGKPPQTRLGRAVRAAGGGRKDKPKHCHRSRT